MLYHLKQKVHQWLFRVAISAQLNLLHPVIRGTRLNSPSMVQVCLCLAVPQPFVIFS